MIALIDYNMGNLLSVSKAFEAAGGEIEIVTSPHGLDRYAGCILPGVGNFKEGMENLRKSGFVEPVKKFARSGKPFAGICLGMQMMLDSSEEAPGEKGLGLIPGKVLRFTPDNGEKVPHMGWNQVNVKKTNPFLAGIKDDSFFYFVHSYYACVENRENILGETSYITPFASIIGSGNIFGAQFHPEKSQQCGLMILENFVRMCQ